jgi:hypothetical protein
VLVDENNYEANKFRVMKTGAIMKEETTGIWNEGNISGHVSSIVFM